MFTHTSFETAKDRGSRRDATAFGGVEAARAAFDTRYHAACRRNLAEVEPAAKADIVIGNDNIHAPVLERI